MDRIQEGIRKAILAGIGITFLVGERAKEMMDRFVRKGEEIVSEKQLKPEVIKERVKDIKDKGESVRDVVARALGLPTRKDYEELLRKIEGLETLLRKGS